VEVSFIGEGKRHTWIKSPTCHKPLTNLITSWVTNIVLYQNKGLLDYLTTHTSLSPIRRGFVPGFVNYKKGCTRFAAASDKVYQLLTHGRWFSPGTPVSSTTKTDRHDIAEILLKVTLSIKNQCFRNTLSHTCLHKLVTNNCFQNTLSHMFTQVSNYNCFQNTLSHTCLHKSVTITAFRTHYHTHV
jgi:hypothetical protein